MTTTPEDPTPGYEDGEDVVGHGEPTLTPEEQAEVDRRAAAGETEPPEDTD